MTNPREGNATPLQYSCLENPMEPGGLQSMGLLSRTRLSDFTFVFSFSLHSYGDSGDVLVSVFLNDVLFNNSFGSSKLLFFCLN